MPRSRGGSIDLHAFPRFCETHGGWEEGKNVLCTSHLVPRISPSLSPFLSQSVSLYFPFYFGPFVERRGRLSRDNTPPCSFLAVWRAKSVSFRVRLQNEGCKKKHTIQTLPEKYSLFASLDVYRRTVKSSRCKTVFWRSVLNYTFLCITQYSRFSITVLCNSQIFNYINL